MRQTERSRWPKGVVYRLRATVVAAALLLTLAGAAREALGAVKILARSGAWAAIGGIADDGKRTCGVASWDQNRLVSIKHFAGRSFWAAQLTNLAWNRPSGTKARGFVQFIFPDRRVLTHLATYYGNTLQFLIYPVELPILETELRRSPSMLLMILPGQETWRLDLSGVADALARMEQCDAGR